MHRITVFLLLLFATNTSVAQSSDEMRGDVRNGPPRTLNSYFPYQPPKSVSEHTIRTRDLQLHMKVALGLWPVPTKTPLNAVIHGKMDLGQYTIEKVSFESFPGFFVTGNLYQPKDIDGRRVPGVLCPHGHHTDGRFRSASDKEIDAQIASGAEKFRANARSPLQVRCAHLAKMGCVVFHYDMLGYADSQQIGYQVAHGFSKQRPEMNSPSAWGLFSPQAESHLQSVMGLQTWNSIRALDFLTSLPQVDPSRIGVTGASGGGTQTFILCAIDSRPSVAFPAVMVSTAMQGGCTCENCSYLRIGFGNVDFAAAFAPKPLGLTAADDWTREMTSKGFPELQALYDVLGQQDHVQLTSRTEFEHNYNQVSREAMYRWFARFLMLDGPLDESEIHFVPPNELSVFDDQHPRPAGGDEFEKSLLQYWSQDSQKLLSGLVPSDNASLEKYRAQIGGPLQVTLGRRPNEEPVVFKIAKGFKTDEPDHGRIRRSFVLRNTMGEEFTTTIQANNKSDPVVLIVDSSGAHVLDEDSPRHKLVDGILTNGFSAATIDHHFINQVNLKSTRQVENNRDFAGYTLGYNSPQIIKKLHDYVGLIFADPQPLERIRFLVSTDSESAGLAALTAAVSSGKLDGVAIDTCGFRFANIRDIRSPNFLPGGAKYFDIPGYLSLVDANWLLVVGESAESLKLVSAARKVRQSDDRLEIFTANSQDSEQLVADWLRRHK